MINLTQYRDILGKPNTGIHSIRFLNISVLDVLLTLLLVKAIQFYFIPNSHFFIIFLSTFILGIFTHKMFGVKTTIDRLLFD